MPLTLIDAALRGMVLALTLLLATLLLRDHRRGPPAVRAAFLLCLGLAVQAIGSAPWVEWHLGCAIQSPLIGLSVGNGVLFLLFSAALFDDTFEWRAWHAVAWLTAAALGAVQCPVVMGLGADEPLRMLLRILLRAVTLLCALGAVWAALRHWRSDLVEARRRLRLLLVGAGIAYTVLQLAARLSTPLGLMTPGLALLDMAVLLAVLGGWALSVLRLPPTGLLAPVPLDALPQAQGQAQPPVAPAPLPLPLPADEALAAALQQAMAADRVYRADDLTLAALALKLAVPEYRLRRHINQRLGFRNFNAYVNSFRLADAKRWLADPAQRDAPILTLALDAGFGSIGPFNRAFKAETGLTPTEFRAGALAESSHS